MIPVVNHNKDISKYFWSYENHIQDYIILLKLLNIWTGNFANPVYKVKSLDKYLIPKECIFAQSFYLYKLDNKLLLWAIYRYIQGSQGIITVARLTDKFNTEQAREFKKGLPDFYKKSQLSAKHFRMIGTKIGSDHSKYWLQKEQKGHMDSFLASLTPENLNTILTLGIFRAPRCEREFTVFRYSSDASLLEQKEHKWISPMFAKIGGKITFGTIQSVAYDWYRVAMNGIIETSKDAYCYAHCCIQVIRVPKKFPFLFMNHVERELLLPPGTVCKVLGFRKLRLNYEDPIPVKNKEIHLEQRREWLKNICEKKKDVAVVDMEIVGLDENLTRIKPIEIDMKLIDKANMDELNLQLEIHSTRGDLKKVKESIKKGATHINDALIKASSRGHIEVVKYLIDQGAEVDVRGDMSLIRASEHGHLKVVEYLVKHGADVTADVNDAICRASENGHFEVVKYLVKKGADVTASNNFAIKQANKNGHTKVVQFLKEHGATL